MELRLAWRRARRQPVGSAAIVLAVALAVAVSTALFSVLDGLLFRPLPFPDPDRIFTVDVRDVNGRLAELVYRPELADRRAALRDALEQSALVTAASQAGHASFLSRGESEDLGLEVHGVDSDFFTLFGLTPILGRALSLDDERSPAVGDRNSSVPLPIVIGHGLWQRLYAGDPQVLGIHELGGRRVRIVGVMGPGVKFPGETNVWAPVPSTRATPPAYIRLAPDATIEQFAGFFPELRFTWLRDVVHPGEVRAVSLLFGAAVVLLIVAWVQVTALTFSGSIAQLQEIGVRLSLGAGRRHLAGQFAVEAAVLAGSAFGLAWLIVGPLTTFIVSLLPEALSRGQYLAPDLRAFLFGCAISLLGLALVTAAPLVVAQRLTPLGLLSGRFSRTSFRAERARRVLLVGQMSLTALLLYLSGLAAHSLLNATLHDHGFDAEHVIVFDTPPWASLGSTNEQLFAAFEENRQKTLASVALLQHVEGVTGVAVFDRAPFDVGSSTPQDPLPISRFDGRARPDIQVKGNNVGVDFVRAFGVTLLAGRGFDAPEYAGRDDIVLVNETLARRLSPPLSVPGEDVALAVVGRPLDLGHGTFEVIGVIGDMVETGLDAPVDPRYYRPYRTGGTYLAIRAASSVEESLPAIRGSLERVWGPLPDRQLSMMRDELDRALAPLRGQSILLALIAACCLPIAAVGLVGALMYAVRAHTRDIAIRVAVGAEPTVVRRTVVRGAFGIVGLGIVLGSAVGATTGSVVATQLFEVRPADTGTLIAVAGGLLALAWLAAAVPARHASRIDPAAALRQV